MNDSQLKNILHLVRQGGLSPEDALDQLRSLSVEVLDCARLDHHRTLRTGIPEVIFGENKSSDQLVEILSAMLRQQNVALATRVDKEKAAIVTKALPALRYHQQARIITGNDEFIPSDSGQGLTVIVTAGTSDIPVAEEARITMQWYGHPVETLYDAGVAGIHRLLAHQETLHRAAVIIVVAGMEGALPSVVAGLVSAPVIGVPSSVGYGTGAGGFSALLGMLNSCAPGIAVVNIDNGFGAACMAAAINRKKD
ncbi:MAG: nickel pincer cofactor biosynthesis protein LarB [Desulfobulbaceae bacterium]|nr:nickel pincer cofactor biosynthesis protein LarB [Desulfobulbaceae bacterium]